MESYTKYKVNIVMFTLLIGLINVRSGGVPGLTICKDNYCGIHSYKDIQRQYSGLFHKHSELLNFDKVNDWVATDSYSEAENDTENLKKTNNASAMDILDDNSICCSTRIEHITNTTLVNMYGQSKYIVHLADATPPNYQYIPHGKCVRTGTCSGQCVVESKVVTLLALEGSSTMKFDMFTIPGYCTCKNVY